MYLCFLIISQLSEVAKWWGTLNIGVLKHALKPLSVPLGYIIKTRAQHLRNPTSWFKNLNQYYHPVLRHKQKHKLISQLFKACHYIWACICVWTLSVHTNVGIDKGLWTSPCTQCSHRLKEHGYCRISHQGANTNMPLMLLPFLEYTVTQTHCYTHQQPNKSTHNKAIKQVNPCTGASWEQMGIEA